MTQPHAKGPLEGLIIDRYLLHRQIGRGGMASVYLAERLSLSDSPHALTPSWVALKVMHPHLVREARSVRRFIEEIALTSQLDHLHICPLLDLGEREGAPYLVLPYLKGKSLAALLERDEPLSPEVVASITLDLARGLSHAHHLTNAEGAPLSMIHRDISPHNVFVEYDGVSKLLDFGIAKLSEPGRDHAETSPLMGKVAYMAPEQLEEEAIDHRVDIWALAVTLWEACAGRPLFDAHQPMRLMYQVLSAPISAPSEHRGSLPEVFDRVSLAGLSRELSERPRDALEWVAPLEAWLRERLSEGGAYVSDEVFDELRWGRVLAWMERNFELSDDLRSAQLSPEERARSLEAFQTTSAPTSTPRSPLLSAPSSAFKLSEPSELSEPSGGAPSVEAVPRLAPRLTLLKLSLIALVVGLLTWGGVVLKSSLRPYKTVKINLSEGRKGALVIESEPCQARVHLDGSRTPLGVTPLTTSIKSGVYNVMLTPLKRTRRCVKTTHLVEVSAGEVREYKVSLRPPQ